MSIYRFRVVLEDNEDIFRDIDILTGQTFEEFHEAIQEAFKFDKKHAASFFVSDDYWRKGLEITLRKEDLPLDEIDIKLNAEPKKLMSATKIAKYVDDPHQHFVYVFDPEVQWTFLIQMLKIANEESKIKYPVCVKSAGTAPKQYKQTNMAKGELTPDMAMAGMLNEPELEENEIYKALKTEGVEEADLAALEGEEGEEAEESPLEGEEEMTDGDEEGNEDFGAFGGEGGEEEKF
jgi:hypothetical protein